MKKFAKLTGFLIATLFVASCANETTNTTTGTEASATTTVVIKATNPQIELDALAKKVRAIDYSRLSISHDGIFSVVLRDKQIGDVYNVGTFTLWRWDGKVWNDVSGSIRDRPLDIKFFEPRSNYGATSVTSYDFNEDGTIDYLVNFDESQLGLNHSAGAILSSRGGTWHWESIMTLDGTISQAAMSWFYWPDSDRLSVRDFPPESMATNVDVRWDTDRKMFVTQSEYVYGD
jgi:hypothetical protein